MCLTAMTRDVLLPHGTTEQAETSTVSMGKSNGSLGNWISTERVKSAIGVGGPLGRVDQLGLTNAVAQVAARTATRTLPKRLAGLGRELVKIAVGRSAIEPDPKDWRFKNKAWAENPAFKRLGQSYLAWARTTTDLVDDARLDWRTDERARLAAGLVTASLAPTNLWFLNPDAIERALETGGRSVVRGLTNVARDVVFNKGFPRSADPGAFKVGCDLAVTPGAVVYRNEVFELLQFAPTTPTVFATPLVLVPPQVNKYYFMDLAPGRSLVEYAVAQGFSMFVVSWRNPTAEQRDWSLDVYVGAVQDAVRTACEIAGSDVANTISLCAGGITTAALLGHLASTGEVLINSATFAVTLLDFSVPTMIGLFGTPDIVRNAVRTSERTGTTDLAETRNLFSMLRPNDLIWNYWVNNNLLGEAPSPFDILFWNSDSTRLPAALHADFLDMFLHNTLASGTFPVFGSPIDLGQVERDTFVVGARTDHLTAWRACYAATQLFGGQSTFVLSSSGHIQSLVNPPGNPKMTVTTGPDPGPDPDEWLSRTTTTTGSWWELWAQWTAARSGERREAPGCLGSRQHPAGLAAPGRYVHDR
jgi:polyhydroxyalkanoate synthase subunit PhaC